MFSKDDNFITWVYDDNGNGYNLQYLSDYFSIIEITPKFKIGDRIRQKAYIDSHEVKDIIFSIEKGAENYVLDNGFVLPIKEQEKWCVVEQEKLTKGRYYVCIRNYDPLDGRPCLFTVGNIYKALDEHYMGYGKDDGWLFTNDEMCFYFRYATDAEIENYEIMQHDYYMCVKDQYSMDGKVLCNKKGKVYKRVSKTCYIESEIEDDSHLYSKEHFRVATEEEIGKKEYVVDSDKPMTEFETAIADALFYKYCEESTETEEDLAKAYAPFKKYATEIAPKLLKVACKQIADSIDSDAMCRKAMIGMGHFEIKAYYRGIEDVKKEIESEG